MKEQQSGTTHTAVYDALGHAVESNTSAKTLFLYGASGAKVAKLTGGTLTAAMVPLTGGETAVYNASGLQYLRHKDWLGSSRLATTWAHAVYSKESYAPFGETYNEFGTPDRSFTGQEQDTVTGNLGSGTYDFPARSYDPAAGRWLSPDPSGWNAVSTTYPQSLNRYAYVQNNPMSFRDPSGLACVYSTDDGVSIDNSNANIGQACTGSGGIYVPGDMQASDLGALSSGQMSFYVANADGGPDEFYGSGDVQEFSSSLQQDALFQMNGVLVAPSMHDDTDSLIGCVASNIAMVNAVSDLSVSMSNVVGQPFIYNGGLDVNFSVPGASKSQLPATRYPSSVFNMVTGIGSSLHVPTPGGADPSTYGYDNQGNFTFTTHIDSAYSTWHTPLGALIHGVVDVMSKGANRGPC